MLADELYEAIAVESLARDLAVPNRADVPTSMRPRFEELSRKEPHPLVPSVFEDAVIAVAAFLDPVLSGDVTVGTWNPSELRWDR